MHSQSRSRNTPLRKWLLQVNEALLGRRTFAIYQALISTHNHYAQSRTELLRSLLSHAAKANPYWKARLSEINPAEIELNDLAVIPLLTRSEIVRHREAMHWRGPGKNLLHKSGGTTDDNLLFYWGRERQQWDRATRARGLARLGVSPGDRILHIWPRENADTATESLKCMARDFRDWLIADPVVDPRPWTHDRLKKLVDWINRFQPRAIIAYPSWLMRIAEFIDSEKLEILIPPKVIMTCGEALFEYQRTYIERVFGTMVRQEYGSQDAGLIAHEDTNQQYQLNTESLIVEILQNGRAAPAGEIGEVVVTHFFTPRMPFIRYATGDIAKMPKNATNSLIDVNTTFPTIEGRTSDLLCDDKNKLTCSRPIIESIMEKTKITRFNLQQTHNGDIEVRSSRQSGILPRNEVETILHEHLGSLLNIHFAIGDEFETLRSGKHRFVCNPHAAKRIAHDAISGTELSRAFPQNLKNAKVMMQ